MRLFRRASDRPPRVQIQITSDFFDAHILQLDRRGTKQTNSTQPLDFNVLTILRSQDKLPHRPDILRTPLLSPIESFLQTAINPRTSS